MEALQTRNVLAAYRRHAAPHVVDALTDCVVDTARGATLHCADGRRMIDMATGGFGYAHPVVKAAVAAQVRKGPLSSRVLISRLLAELVLKLDALAPGDLTVSYVCNSGEEALDSALKLTKGHWPDRPDIVVMAGADYGTLSHGTHFAGIGSRFLDRLPFKPKRVAFGDTDQIVRAIDGRCAAVLLEPLSIDSGLLEASVGFWKAVRAACDRTGTLMIVSELRTGLGRTGTALAIERIGVVPDVLILGGALGGGHISIGAYIASERVNSKVYDNRNPTLHGSTTGGNPASCAAALAALSVIEQEMLPLRHETLGIVASARLADCRAAGVRAVQRVGSIVAIDFVDARAAADAHQRAHALGLLLRKPVNDRLLLNPPLTVSPEEFEQGADLLFRAITGTNAGEGAQNRKSDEVSA